MVLILINKDAFEPSYNDLKFMVQKSQLCLHQPSKSHMPQLRVRMPQLKIPCALSKTQHSQINK